MKVSGQLGEGTIIEIGERIGQYSHSTSTETIFSIPSTYDNSSNFFDVEEEGEKDLI